MATVVQVMDSLQSTDSLIEFAKNAEQAERYDDMVKAMKKVIENEKKLSMDQRNLFSVAYKNVVGARRSSWRVICMIEQKADKENHKKLSKEMRVRVEEELEQTCNEVLDLLDILLAPLENTKGGAEEKVFYWKMKGDYCRYKAEYMEDDPEEGSKGGKKRCTPKNDAKEAYEKAMRIADPKRDGQEGADKDEAEMKPTHPNRLGLALNFSVFYYEILNQPDMACKLAKQAFDDAINELNDMKDSDCKDSTLIMQLLRDNLTLWTSDAPDQNCGDAQD